VCLISTHRVVLQQAKYFAWDDAKNAKLRKERDIGFEEIVFHIERGDLLDIWSTRTLSDTPANASSSSGARTTSTSCRSSKMTRRSS
jgi:hypothetical protein